MTTRNYWRWRRKVKMKVFDIKVDERHDVTFRLAVCKTRKEMIRVVNTFLTKTHSATRACACTQGMFCPTQEVIDHDIPGICQSNMFGTMYLNLADVDDDVIVHECAHAAFAWEFYIRHYTGGFNDDDFDEQEVFCYLRPRRNGWNQYSENPLADPVCNSPWGTGRVPRYVADDILWVRETWQKTIDPDTDDTLFVYKADNDDYVDLDGEPTKVKWKPSIHMPREAARICLEVKSVRVERLQDISEEDAKAEGVQPEEELKTSYCSPHREAFHRLWDSLNAKRGYGWDSNPWVWVIGFERKKK
jgi:hypothetical protein